MIECLYESKDTRNDAQLLQKKRYQTSSTTYIDMIRLERLGARLGFGATTGAA
jgi:hypothetical protein